MKTILLFLICLVANLSIAAQKANYTDNSWTWIVPLKTEKKNIEKKYGSSINKDKKHPFQTYSTEFGKITVAYSKENQLIKSCSCVVNKDIVLNYFISPKDLKLSDLNYNLENFKKDITFSPREISYYSENESLLISTEIVELIDKSNVEKVIGLLYRPKVQKAKLKNLTQ